MARSNERGITPQGEDFSAWYNELVLRAELADRGPARGTIIIRPYGYRIWELIEEELDRRIKQTGHLNAYFPLLIPESHLRKEAEHVGGFAPELAVVTHGGGKELDEPLVVRPTSETVVGEAFARWIDSYRDLPMLINQWANVVRWELRPRLFLRTTEFLWQEGHTAHASEKEALAEAMTAVGFYEEIARDICAIPVVIGEKTASERFAGAQRTFALEALVRDGRALQAATSHYLGTNFARAFDMTFTNESGVLEHCFTTSWGMSTRMIGAIIMTHGDDKGLILPPRVAPFQVVIVPIGRDKEIDTVMTAARELNDSLRSSRVRVHLDERTQLSPGFKFNEWELRGVPLRIELGPRDLSASVATFVDRLTGEKEQVPLKDAASEIASRLELFQGALYDRAQSFRDEHTSVVDTWDDFVTAVGQGFASALLCDDVGCELRIKDLTTATPRVIPFDGLSENGPCISCGRPSTYPVRILFARAY